MPTPHYERVLHRVLVGASPCPSPNTCRSPKTRNTPSSDSSAEESDAPQSEGNYKFIFYTIKDNPICANNAGVTRVRNYVIDAEALFASTKWTCLGLVKFSLQ